MRLTKGTLGQLDKQRGDLSRSEYLRHLVTQTVAEMHDWVDKLPEATAPVPDARKSGGMTTEPDLGRPARKIRVEPIKKPVKGGCDHTWVRAGTIFDRCTKCEERKRH